MRADSLESRYRRVLDRIAEACVRAGRDPAGVTLVAVSKTFTADLVAELHGLGHADFGENKVQELVEKGSVLPGLCRGGTVRWHMIGHLQRNKARDVVEHADMFHALDSLRLARELSRRCTDAGRTLPCLVQVNVSGELSKYGIDPEAVHGFVDEAGELPGLHLRGLMTLAAPADNPEDVRPQLRLLRRLAESYPAAGPGVRLDCLSMGMSGDFEVAIGEGATHVRIGSAIFGERTPH
jgi:hypothetical protein